jgi:hypothetical protein
MHKTTQQMHADIFAAAATTFGPNSPMNQKLREDLGKAAKAHDDIVKQQRRRNLITGTVVAAVVTAVAGATLYKKYAITQ